MLDKLIEEGELVKKTCIIKPNSGNLFIKGENYEKWMIKCIMFLEKNYLQETFTEIFKEASRNSSDQKLNHFDRMLGILKAIKEFNEQ